MNELTLPSRHRIRHSSPGGLRPSTLPLGYGGSPQYGGGEGVTSAWSPLGNFLERQAHPNLSSNQVLLFFLT